MNINAISDAERGFSILFHSLDDRRKRLTIEAIDAILRVRINGPDLKDFDCHKILKAWDEEGHLRSNAQPPRGKAKKNKVEETEDPIENQLEDEYTRIMWEKRFLPFIRNIDEL